MLSDDTNSTGAITVSGIIVLKFSRPSCQLIGIVDNDEELREITEKLKILRS